MYNAFQLASKYLYYLATASNGRGHGMHSPFVFDFIRHVLLNSDRHEVPVAIERKRRELLGNHTVIAVEDYGVGSRNLKNERKKVSSIAQHALKSRKYAQLLFRAVKYYQPKTILELGTSLGITTAYLSSANPDSKIITVEGSETIAAIAQQNFEQLGITNVDMHIGKFDDLLPNIIDTADTLDFCFIDGNHRYDATVRYFRILLEKAGVDSVFVFDDIHWSEEMEAAWKEIISHPEVQYSIDLFYMGFVFFRKEFKVKQDFVIRF